VVEAAQAIEQTLPLDGLTVLDFSQFLAGPSCALRLADLGAHVIKIERPKGGDACRDLRLADQTFDQDSALFHTINRNKRSYAADLKDAVALERVKRLVARADVLIHNFRPGIMDRLGLGYDTLAALNPGIVYAGVSGYGPDGPWRDKPGQDLLVQSLSGIAWMSGDGDQAPVPVGLSITDMMAGAHLTQGILALLIRRGVSGRGGRVDVSLMETAVDLQFENLTAWLNGALAPKRSMVAGANAYLGAPYGIYRTADGHLALAMMRIDTLGKLIDCDALLAFPIESWFVERDAIKALIRDHLATQATAHWLGILEPQGVWCAEVQDWQRLVAHPGFAAIDVLQTVHAPDGTAMRTTRCPIRIDGAILKSDRAAPRLGADTFAIDAALVEQQA
jgi:crotonobetainyl-CoA:carnitine CoA-transferase CaiB-like acyl-CoA transferase